MNTTSHYMPAFPVLTAAGVLPDPDRDIQEGITELREELGRTSTPREFEALMRRQKAITARWEALCLATMAAWERSLDTTSMDPALVKELTKRIEACR